MAMTKSTHILQIVPGVAASSAGEVGAEVSAETAEVFNLEQLGTYVATYVVSGKDMTVPFKSSSLRRNATL
jgi:hypothetical protein